MTITSELLTAIGQNVLAPVRIEALREQLERVQGLYDRASELGYFLSHQHPTPAALYVPLEGHCGECLKQRSFDTNVDMGMFEAWLDELEKQCALIVKGAEAKARAELERASPAPPKPKKGSRR
jgi:hypothetical protein